MVKPESVTPCVCVVCKPVMLAAAATVGVFTLSHSGTSGGRATTFNNLAGSSRQGRYRRHPPATLFTTCPFLHINYLSFCQRGLCCLHSL